MFVAHARCLYGTRLGAPGLVVPLDASITNSAEHDARAWLHRREAPRTTIERELRRVIDFSIAPQDRVACFDGRAKRYRQVCRADAGGPKIPGAL
jgi:hypothetical protein